MTCVEKRHMNHRVGSMLHHRFPNGFTDMLMDETDREVSTLTDRAFRSLCVGDDAVFNDEFLYGYSPFNCHKPLVGEPLKKTHHKESKKQGQNKTDKNYAQQQHKNISHISSFLKALSATEESCEGMLIKNGGMPDTNVESWDKSALRSIQRELSDFSSDYHTNLTEGHHKNHHRHHTVDGFLNKTGKNAALPSEKFSKSQNGKSTVKLRKLNIKNFFLHSEFSPFQSWRDFKQFPFGQEETSILPLDKIPKWYDLPFYKELTEAHRKETQHTEEAQSCQKAAPPLTAPKPIPPPPPPPPPKVLPKPIATMADKRCSSDGGDGSAAPWRRNRSRARSVIPVNQPSVNSSKTLDESLWLLKEEARCVEVKAIEEVNSLASTPFSICQLMTPLIPSRQPTETSEILQTILSPTALDLPQRPHSEAKMTPEPPVKRDSYKSLASSILFNLKDNRKRVKSRYSPPKFKTLQVPEGGTQSPQSDHLKSPQAGSEGYASGLSTPAILKDGHAVCSPVLESNSTPTVALTKHIDRPLSVDYLLSNLLQTKRDASGSLGEENPISPFTPLKKTKNPKAKKQNYPSLNLYKKASPDDSDMKYLLVPPTEANEFSPLTLNKDLSPKALPTNNGFSPIKLNVDKDCSPIISPHALEKVTNVSVGKRAPNVADKAKQPVKDIKEKDFGSKEKDTCGQPMSTMDVIRAAREAISAAKNKALSATQSDSINKLISDTEEVREKEIFKKGAYSKELYQSRNEATLVEKIGNVKKEPPPVPKRNFAKSDIQLSLDKKQNPNDDKLTNGDSEDAKLNVSPNENDSLQKQAKLKYLFSARQNNYIKHQRYTVMDDEQGVEFQEGDLNVNTGMDVDKEMMPVREMRDSGHIINDLQALKELERARLGDRLLENTKNKLGVLNIDEEARAKNDLISRELRNIKKGMLSMRGNTTAKKELFAQKEKDQSKQETFTKIDANVIVNKALINDNYDRAKMALEEIISDRQKRKNNFTEQDANPIFDENTDESYETRVEQRKNAMKDSTTEAKEKQNGSTPALKEKELKERLSDLRDHNHMRQILSQTEPRIGETHKSGMMVRSDGRLALPGMDKIDDPNFESDEVNLRNIVRQISEESGENNINQNDGKKVDVPSVPPRSKKGGSRKDGSVFKDTGSLKNSVEDNIFIKDVKCENDEVRLKEIRSIGSGKQQVYSDSSPHDTSPVKERWDVVNKSITGTDGVICDSILPSTYLQSENRLCLSPEFKGNEKKVIILQDDMSPIRETIFNNSNVMAKETPKVKRKAPLRPDHLNTPDYNVNKKFVAGEPNKINRAIEEIHVDTEALGETHRDILSPLLLVNGKSVNQSPPDQASLSSKSSYFSVESTLNRNTETGSNVYHSLENLIGEEEEVDEVPRNSSRNTKQDSDRMEVEYYSLSDHESEPEVKRQIKCPQKETEVPYKDSKERDNTTSDKSVTYEENNSTPMSPSNTFSLSLGIPALFKVKDITLSNKLIKTVQPWSPRESLSGSERVEELDQVQGNPELLPATEPATRGSTPIPAEIFKPKAISSKSSPPLLLSPLNLQSENPKKPQAGGFLTVPQEEDRLSGVSPSSEGVESLTTSTADTAEEMGKTAEVSKVPSERSGSTCSGNESQTGLPKPPVVLPKSEKAVLKAIKLANRRMKKEEAQKSSHRSSQSGSKHRVDRHKSDKPEPKSSSGQSSKSSERNHREKMEDGRHHNESHHGKTSDDQSEQIHYERRGHRGENQTHDRTCRTRRQSHDSAVSITENNEAPPSVATERQGRRSNRHIREKPEQRPYSSDRVISNVPVYKAQLSERPTTDRPINRSQSIDRYSGDQVECRPSVDKSVNEKFDPRTQRIEKSIVDGLQQRGRAREKASTHTLLRRSHSIDSYPNPNPHPSSLSRQSSHTSQLSRQSSIEHTIVTQSFPMTQRKLLQDPDSGQYFFVDMPVQVKTKTFFDPETRSYVQLPVQPPEGAVPQASPLEVLTQPLVVYHSFVPVPLSPMAQKTPIQAPHMEPRLRQMHCKDGHPYLEPVYSQHDHMLGEFLGTEEVDCPS